MVRRVLRLVVRSRHNNEFLSSAEDKTNPETVSLPVREGRREIKSARSCATREQTLCARILVASLSRIGSVAAAAFERSRRRFAFGARRKNDFLSRTINSSGDHYRRHLPATSAEGDRLGSRGICKFLFFYTKTKRQKKRENSDERLKNARSIGGTYITRRNCYRDHFGVRDLEKRVLYATSLFAFGHSAAVNVD